MNHFTTAARHLRLAGALFEARAHHRTQAVVDIVTTAFKFTADAFDSVAPGAYEELPEDLADAVTALDAVFRAHDFHVSPALIAYAIEPVTGALPVMKSADAISEVFARQDLDLQVRRSSVLDSRNLASDDDEKVSWALRALNTIHYQHEKLAEVIAADNARPDNEGKLPFRLREWREEATLLAAAAGPKNGHKLIAALQAVGIPAWFAEDSGVSYVIAGVDKTLEEGEAHTGPKVYIYCGEQADLNPAEHDEPWACALYGRDGDFVDVLFTAPTGLDLDSECGHVAVQLAHWLERNAEKHPRA
ncbi:hypothetical protein AB0A05_07480 [Streptomyces sp. NPDC046374]|uniref:hypothetical protein n=1 Tax=Streptomyces sp. NPDC046374 TaxID=3154917 RepID=UPI0033C45519